MKAYWTAVAFVVGAGVGGLVVRAAGSAPTGPAPALKSAGPGTPTKHVPPAKLEDDHDHHASVPQFDEGSLARALAVFADSNDPEAILRTAASLGASGGPKAAQAAASVLARGGATPVELVRRAAAFEVLAAQEDPAARAPALAVLAHETDAELRRSAVSALGASRRGSDEEAATISAQLSRLIESDKDPEVRRRAVRAFVRWRTSDSQVATLIRVLETDKDENVRGAAAFSFEDERVRSPAAIAALGRVVADATAPKSVRELAAEALSRLGPLDEATRQILNRFDQEP